MGLAKELRDAEKALKRGADCASENGYCESFNGELRDECLNQEIFYSLKEAQIVIQQWRNQYNTIRPLIARISAAGAAKRPQASSPN